MTRDSIYRWVGNPDGGSVLHNVGILADGTLHNPNNYPEDLARRAVQAAEARRHNQRKAAAQKAASTRARRHALKVTKIAQAIVAGHRFGPAEHCVICRKALSDEASMGRGIGSDCWQDLLRRITEIRAEREVTHHTQK
jgi:hypothetical protein